MCSRSAAVVDKTAIQFRSSSTIPRSAVPQAFMRDPCSSPSFGPSLGGKPSCQRGSRLPVVRCHGVLRTFFQHRRNRLDMTVPASDFRCKAGKNSFVGPATSTTQLNIRQPVPWVSSCWRAFAWRSALPSNVHQTCLPGSAARHLARSLRHGSPL
jgi:hypothetical protein